MSWTDKELKKAESILKENQRLKEEQKNYQAIFKGNAAIIRELEDIITMLCKKLEHEYKYKLSISERERIENFIKDEHKP